MLRSYPMPLSACILILTAIFGTVAGSALNCLADRLISGRKWSGNSRSICPCCGHTLGPRDLVPVLSWLVLKGKCRYCHEKISPRYPVTELLLAACYVSLVLRFDLTLHALSLMILCSCLFCLSLVDLDSQIIPDRFLVIPAVFRGAELIYESSFLGLFKGLLPGIFMAAAVWLISLLMEKILKKETMGLGDIKLLAVLGMYLSFPECFVLVIASCVIGIVMGAVFLKAKPQTPFPFGPAISLAGWATLLAGKPVVSWYLELFM